MCKFISNEVPYRNFFILRPTANPAWRNNMQNQVTSYNSKQRKHTKNVAANITWKPRYLFYYERNNMSTSLWLIITGTNILTLLHTYTHWQTTSCTQWSRILNKSAQFVLYHKSSSYYICLVGSCGSFEYIMISGVQLKLTYSWLTECQDLTIEIIISIILEISLISSSWLRTVAWVCVWESATSKQSHIKIIVFTVWYTGTVCSQNLLPLDWPEDGSSRFFWNVSIYLQNNTASHPRGLTSYHS